MIILGVCHCIHLVEQRGDTLYENAYTIMNELVDIEVLVGRSIKMYQN